MASGGDPLSTVDECVVLSPDRRHQGGGVQILRGLGRGSKTILLRGSGLEDLDLVVSVDGWKSESGSGDKSE